MRLSKSDYINIVFIDSGLGGLSVMADFFIRLHQSSEHLANINLLFVNALYAENLGYNKMSGVKQKADLFDQALFAVEERFSPEHIAIACNTLSVIYPHTSYAQKNPSNVHLISETGIRILDDYHRQNPSTPVFVPATLTTIEAGIYDHPSETIQPISAGTLASEIENDSDGHRIDSVIRALYAKIQSQTQNGLPVSMLLGCTHFGYILRRFHSLAKKHGLSILDIINPNDFFSTDIYQRFLQESKFPAGKGFSDISCAVFSRTRIPVTVRKRISKFLPTPGQPVADALLDYRCMSDLF